MIITIAGDLGSGKSTVGKLLAKELNYDFFSTGNFMRELALEKNISLHELSELAENDGGAVDKILDQRQIDFAKTHDNFIIDSRLGWHFIKGSVKIFLKVDALEAAKRIYSDKERTGESNNTTVEKTKERIILRKDSERKRYLQYYDLVYDDPKNFDIVIDTTNISAKDACTKILNLLPSN